MNYAAKLDANNLPYILASIEDFDFFSSLIVY